LVAIRALAFVHVIGLSSIILKGDYEVVTKILRSDDESLTSFGLLIVETKLYTDIFSYVFFLSHP